MINKIEDDLQGRNQNWDMLETHLADYETHKAETSQQLNDLDEKKLDKNGTISVSQINKNLGKLDQTYLSDELIQQMAGDTPVNAIPADESITTIKLAEKAVTTDKTNFATYEKIPKVIADVKYGNITYTEGQFYDLNTGELSNSPIVSHSQKFDCDELDLFYTEAGTFKGQALFWDKDGNYLGYRLAGSTSRRYYFRPYERATKIAFNNTDSSVASDTVYQSIQTIKKPIFKDGAGWKKVIRKSPAKIIHDWQVDRHEGGTGYYVSTVDGSVSMNASTNWKSTLPIKVKPNHPYRTKVQAQIVFFDDAMNFISSHIPNATLLDVEDDFITPENCEYLCVNTLKDYQVLYDLEYEEYVPINERVTDKVVVHFGDSITGAYPYGDNYPYWVEKITKMKTYNVGIGGTRMANIEANNQNTNTFSMATLSDAVVSGDFSQQEAHASDVGVQVPFRVKILKSIDFNNVDIVTIAYGANEGGLAQDNENDKFDTYTYKGAARYAVKNLLEAFPHLRIVLLTPFYRFYDSEGLDSDERVRGSTGLKLTDNVQSIKEVAEELKVPFVDMYYSLGINKYNRLEYYSPTDGVHPLSNGRKLIGERLAGELLRLFGS